MKYVSTRDAGKSVKINSAEAIKRGISDDGGLFMPCEIIKIDAAGLKKMQKMAYSELASHILSLYLTDYSKETLNSIAEKSYSTEKFGDSPAVLSKIDAKRYVLELHHGPTSAFKDMALQIMPRLLSEALNITGETRSALILVATSGDTGKAALEGFKDTDKVNIAVFYPKDGVSAAQKLQMDTQEGGNVNVCAVDGNFDDCQTGVKNIFNDGEVKNTLNKKNMFFSSANSINFGRLIPQVVYYFYAYLEMSGRGDIEFGEKIDVCVPTGNFGNIFAGYMAKEMGLPIGKLICASNKNNILTDFFKTGVYDKNREFFTTMSPSMDILISSNLERLLYLTEGAERTAEYMEKLKSEGRYSISETTRKKLNKDFIGIFCDERHTAGKIKETFDKYGYLIDTHTAVAFSCADEYIADAGDVESKKTLIISTASAYKFAGDVYSALTGIEIKPGEDDKDGGRRALDRLADYTKTKIPRGLKELAEKKIRFRDGTDADGMKDYIIDFIVKNKK